MSGLFRDIALGITAYNSVRISQNTDATNAAVQGMLAFEEIRARRAYEQQNLRDTIFQVQTAIRERFGDFNAAQALYWATWLQNKLIVEGIEPNKAETLADKTAIYTTIQELKNSQKEAIARLPGHITADTIVENARLSFAIPYLRQLAAHAELRQLVPQKKQSPFWKTPIIIGVSISALVGLVVATVDRNPLGAISIFGFTSSWLTALLLLPFWVVRKASDASPPRNWDKIKLAARNAGYYVNKTTRSHEVAMRMSFLEDQLACVGEPKQNDFRQYPIRAQEAQQRFDQVDQLLGQ